MTNIGELNSIKIYQQSQFHHASIHQNQVYQ